MTFTARAAVINSPFIPAGHLPAVAQLVARSEKSRGGYITVSLSLPHKPRSTGERSQLNRHWGHCEDIAEQLSTAEQVYTKRDIDAGLRRMAVSAGLPTLQNFDGAEEPIHFDDAMWIEQADIVERVKQRFADEHNLWLTEYDDTVSPPVPYRSVGGRSRAEMAKYNEEA